VLEVMKKEKARWTPRVRDLAAANPTWSEVELSWAIIEEMAIAGAAVLEPVFERAAGRNGRLSVQTNPANHRDPVRMVEQAVRFAALAPNIQVKFPATAAGIAAIEEATFRGVNINATVSFTVPQALAAAEAVERGLDRRSAAGGDVASMTPIVTIMIGRLDDWMKVLIERDDLAVHPDAPNWAGVAAFKRAYAIFHERGYRSRLLAAAYRHRLHWTELVGGDVSLTLPYPWQVRFNKSGIAPTPRMDLPVDPALVADLYDRIPDFRRAYDPDGLTPDEFEGYGASARTLRTFVKSYHDLQAAIRDLVLPDPDVRPA
jgi:transaldolase